MQENTTYINNEIDLDNNMEVMTKREDSEKISTKGLKLKESTKIRLNELQNKYGDAETLITKLLSYHDTLNTEELEEYSDRKVEVEKFTSQLESIKKSYIQSLDIAKYSEEKYAQRFANEFNKKDKIIAELKEEHREQKEIIKKLNNDLNKNQLEYQNATNTFSSLNKVLATVEKELTLKTEALNNSQEQVSALLNVVNENSKLKEENNKLQNDLNDAIKYKEKYYSTEATIKTLTNEKNAIDALLLEAKEEIKTSNNDNKILNNKIQDILLLRNEETNKVKEEMYKKIEELKEKNTTEVRGKEQEIITLKEEIAILKAKIELVYNK